MKELWDTKGYSDLGFSSQNLRDQAARLEKSLRQTSRDVHLETQAEDHSVSHSSIRINIELNHEEIKNEEQNANHSSTTNPDLHTQRIPQIPGDLEPNERDEVASIPGCLPNYKSIDEYLGETERWKYNLHFNVNYIRCLR